MSKRLNLEGLKFGNLTVKSSAPDIIKSNGRIYPAWYCDCDCGTKNYITTTERLRSGKYKSCGCLNKSNQFKIHRNNYKICENYTVFYTRNGEEFYVDTEDIEIVKQYTWCIAKGYVINNDGILLHRLIMNAPSNKDIDHINHNKLDNRKCNLRIVFDYENMWNQKIAKNNTSGATGVYLNKATNKWFAQIEVKGKKNYLGSFNTFEKAREARKIAEEKYFGKYSYDNSIMEGKKNERVLHIS